MYLANNNRVPISKIYLDKFDKECAGKGYRDLIHGVLNDNTKAVKYPKGANKLLSIDGKTVQDLNTVILKHKGKLIFLDFWASWCGPCLDEIPYNAKLKKKYEGKNIVFLTISTDSNITDWQKAAKEEAMKVIIIFYC